ncbi:Alpha-xylosidase [Anaerohalosphaera lusitana]|uniref:Alpha-xylosidase n=1 Tax=Anaerohalosphaera lusitana TaxID=1936003 RepID=A0A1U9NPH4_9BACT|nr:NPCBM/NEW2 domain-containing protein [Anaerohalosphaera lusitana]AQT69618.1 Alpha-xylosidase [Anaerohalosphaera lusitana]
MKTGFASNQLVKVVFVFLLCLAAGFTAVADEHASKPGAVEKFTQRPAIKEYTAQTDNGYEVRVIFYQADVFRISAAYEGDFADPRNNPEKAQIVINHVRDGAEIKVTETDDSVTFTSDVLELSMDKQNCRFELKDSDGELMWEEMEPLQFGEKTVQKLSTEIDEYFYGGGQQNGYFSHKGTKIDIRADGNWNEGGHPNPAPFYLSSKGYGVLRNTFATGAYDFTSNQSISLMHNEDRFDAYYFVGDSFHRVVDLYTKFTGRPNFVPLWALQLGEADAWMTRDKETGEPLKDEDGNFVEITTDVIDRCAEQYRKHDMPGGWLLVNDGYGCGYVELPYVVDSLEALGFYTGLWTEKGLAKTEWEVGTAGTRLQKLDVAWTGPAYQWSLDANKQAWESLVSNSETRGFVWTVQGWAGTQRYSVCWTGDQAGSWDLIRYHIPTLIGSGMSGQAYATTDVDGIFGGSPETYTRDLQWKCFTPVLYAMNGWSRMNKSPWSYEEPYLSINRKYLKLKNRMMPYMYKYTKEAYDTGAPIVRGMIWNYPEDKKTWDKTTQYQYMLGDWMVIAPVYTSMNVSKGWRKEDIYLPDGQWIDYWDGRRIEGPKTIDAYPVTLEKLPVIVKAGAIIPMYPEMLYTGQKAYDPLTFDIYPYGESSFEMYEDDGKTREYQNGEFATQLIEVKAPKGVAGDVEVTVGPSVGQFDGKLDSRVYQFTIHSEVKPDSITVDGEEVLELTEPKAYDSARQAWYYDAEDRRGIVHIRLARRSTDESAKLHLDIDEDAEIPASPDYPVPEVRPDLDKSEFTVTTNSQQGNSINNAFDGTPETIWHSNYSKNPGDDVTEHPYIIDIGLNGLYAINGLEYMARQNLGNGMIKDFELYIGRSKDDYGEPVYKGSFEPIKEMQHVDLPVTWGEFVRIKILNGFNGNKFGSAAEFNVLRDLNAEPLPDKVVYLSDLEPASVKGEYRMDKSIGGRTITVNDQTYRKGIGVSSGSELVYKLDGPWDKLTGHVGLDDEVGSGGSAMFRVFADGKLIFESPDMTGDNVKQLMDLDIRGVEEVRLVLIDTGETSDKDHGDWVDAKLVLEGSE